MRRKCILQESTTHALKNGMQMRSKYKMKRHQNQSGRNVKNAKKKSILSTGKTMQFLTSFHIHLYFLPCPSLLRKISRPVFIRSSRSVILSRRDAASFADDLLQTTRPIRKGVESGLASTSSMGAAGTGSGSWDEVTRTPLSRRHRSLFRASRSQH